MKLLIGLIITIVAAESKNLFEDGDSQTIKNKIQECKTATKIDRRLLTKLGKGKIPEGDKVKEYIHCVMTKIPIVGEDGQILDDRNKLMSVTVLQLEENEAKSLIKECKNQTGQNAADNSLLVYKCLQIDEALQAEYIFNACLSETNVDNEIVTKASRGVIVNDPLFKDFIFCALRRIGFANAEGKILLSADEIRQGLPYELSSAEKDDAIATCNVQWSDAARENLFLKFKCFREKYPSSYKYFF